MVENELQFVDWEEFQEMVPSILQLEISRLNRTIEEVEDAETTEALVGARKKLDAFVACLASADKDTLESTCAPHLEGAMLTLSIQADEETGETADTLQYIVDRINHVHDRMELVY